MGINALPEPQDTTFKLLSSATLQRGMSTRLRFVTKDFLPLKQVQDMVGSTFSVTIERGSGANIQDTRVSGRLNEKLQFLIHVHFQIVTRLDLQPLVAPADLVNGTAPQSSSLSSPPPQRTGSVSCQQDASVTGAIWSVKLDSRPLTTSFLAETSLCNGYAAHLMNEFVRLGHLLQLVAECELTSRDQPAKCSDGLLGLHHHARASTSETINYIKPHAGSQAGLFRPYRASGGLLARPHVIHWTSVESDRKLVQ